MMQRVVGLLLLLVLAPLARAEESRLVRVETNLGGFTIQLDAERAPLTVENFLRYVRDGYYSNTLIHRVIANFVIQGGGLSPDYQAKPGRPPIPNEAGNGLHNVRGSVGLARTAKPHSGDTQFYVNLADNPDLDPLPSRWGYAVFGKIIEGMDVVDRIGLLPTGAGGPIKSDVPVKPVIIERAWVLGETPSSSSSVGTSPPAAAQPAAAQPASAPPPAAPVTPADPAAH